uniref:Transmembrane protein n=1 Tax=Heterorhabditis bacteriophora TaxID=37862 RepID=A0A1I7WUV0_HETBA
MDKKKMQWGIHYTVTVCYVVAETRNTTWSSIVSNIKMLNDSEANKVKGIPNGALTVLIIAAIAIVSVAITLICMLVNNRRARRIQQRVQQLTFQRMTLSTTRVSLSSDQSLPSIPSMPHTESAFPMYITPAPLNSKFDAPPSYEEATRSAPVSPISDLLNPLDSSNTNTPARSMESNGDANRLNLSGPSVSNKLRRGTGSEVGETIALNDMHILQDKSSRIDINRVETVEVLEEKPNMPQKRTFVDVVKTAMIVRNWMMSIQENDDDRMSDVNSSIVFEPPPPAEDIPIISQPEDLFEVETSGLQILKSTATKWGNGIVFD